MKIVLVILSALVLFGCFDNPAAPAPNIYNFTGSTLFLIEFKDYRLELDSLVPDIYYDRFSYSMDVPLGFVVDSTWNIRQSSSASGSGIGIGQYIANDNSISDSLLCNSIIFDVLSDKLHFIFECLYTPKKNTPDTLTMNRYVRQVLDKSWYKIIIEKPVSLN